MSDKYNVSAWSLDGLEALSKQQVALGNRMLAMLPLAAYERGALAHISSWLEELTKARYVFELHRLRVHPGGDVPDAFGDSFVSWLQLPPERERGALIVDLHITEELVAGLVEELPAFDRYPLDSNPYDYGLTVYLLLRLLDRLGALGLPPLVVSTEQPTHEAIKSFWSRYRCDLVEIVYFAIGRSGRRGLVRLLLPAGFVQAGEAFTYGAMNQAQCEERIVRGPLCALSLALPATLAMLPLSCAEFCGLLPGDVLLPSEHGLLLDGLDACGSGRLHINATQYLACNFFEGANGRWQAIALSLDLRLQTAPGKEIPMTEHDLSEERTSSIAQAAVLNLEVRIGELAINIGELARLQSGQVLPLERTVSSAVDLVINAKIVGAGELVNIEGRLGVRVLWMANR
ncbi:MAG: FliM/FliN family flagellar motor switch protein [Bradymonadaceae bacterium]|nr:FliM/FliN family flagellar motor switch protein [Lujinxingiaceae bacterium]